MYILSLPVHGVLPGFQSTISKHGDALAGHVENAELKILGMVQAKGDGRAWVEGIGVDGELQASTRKINIRITLDADKACVNQIRSSTRYTDARSTMAGL